MIDALPLPVGARLRATCYGGAGSLQTANELRQAIRFPDTRFRFSSAFELFDELLCSCGASDSAESYRMICFVSSCDFYRFQPESVAGL